MIGLCHIPSHGVRPHACREARSFPCRTFLHLPLDGGFGLITAPVLAQHRGTGECYVVPVIGR
jgi:hypothetical protein